MKIYSFYDDIAAECGINASILFYNISHWVDLNEKNGNNFHDGRYWTFNSMEAFSGQFPFLSAKQIRTALAKLEDHGYILTGNYNKLPFDRTKWYSITEKGYSVLPTSEIEKRWKEKKHLPTMAEMICPDGQKGFDQSGRPIPDIKPNDKQLLKKERKKEDKKTTSYDSIINESIQDDSVKQEIYEFIKMRKLIKKPMTDRALKGLISKLNELSSNPVDQAKILERSVINDWQSVYPLPSNNNGYQNNNDYQGNTEVKRDGSEYSEFDY